MKADKLIEFRDELIGDLYAEASLSKDPVIIMKVIEFLEARIEQCPDGQEIKEIVKEKVCEALESVFYPTTARKEEKENFRNYVFASIGGDE